MKGRKREKQTGVRPVLSLADINRRDRTALVGEVLGAFYAVNGYVADHFDEDTLRALCKRLDVPLMVLAVKLDAPIMATPEDLTEWCAFERKAVA